MGKVGTAVKITLAGTLLPTAAFVVYRKREIAAIHRAKREEVAKLNVEFDNLAPKYRRLIAAQQSDLEEAKAQEELKGTLWEDRIRRFRAETAEFMTYVTVLPQQLAMLEELNKMYWLVFNVLQDTRVDEVRFEATCRKVHQALLAGHPLLFQPDAVPSKAALLQAVRAVHAAAPDPLLEGLARAVERVEGDPAAAHEELEGRFLEGLALVDATQFSVSGPEQQNLMGRLFSKAQQSMSCALPDRPVSDLTAHAPRKFVTEEEVQQGLRFAEDFVAAARAGQIKVAATQVPIVATPEGRDALRHLDGWLEGARAYVSLQQLAQAARAHLLSSAIRLGLPPLPKA